MKSLLSQGNSPQLVFPLLQSGSHAVREGMWLLSPKMPSNISEMELLIGLIFKRINEISNDNTSTMYYVFLNETRLAFCFFRNRNCCIRFIVWNNITVGIAKKGAVRSGGAILRGIFYIKYKFSVMNLKGSTNGFGHFSENSFYSV